MMCEQTYASFVSSSITSNRMFILLASPSLIPPINLAEQTNIARETRFINGEGVSAAALIPAFGLQCDSLSRRLSAK